MSNTDINKFIKTANNSLKEILEELEFISRLSEKEFLHLSGKLQQYHASSKKTNEIAFSFANLLSGDKYHLEIEKLANINTEIFSSITSTNQKFNDSNISLEQIIQLLENTTKEVSNFGRLVKYLRVQGISTKIESSRLGGDDAGFSHLAENVEQLSTVIADKTKNFKESSSDLVKIIRAVRIKTLDLEKYERENSDKIKDSTEKSLATLVQKYKLSADKSKILSHNFEETQKRIGNIVTSIQFHDITRQQIEHIHNSLTQLMDKLFELQNDDDYDAQQKVYTFVNQICKIQNAQFANSTNELSSAAQTIISNLEGVADNIEGIDKEVSELLESNEDSYTPFIENIKEDLSKVVSSLNSNDEVSAQLSKSIAGVAGTINELSGFVNQINNIGSDIELISLNANIKAAHIGNEGAALGVLAKEIQKLSIDAINQTEKVIGYLAQVNSHSDELQKLIHKNNSETDDTNELTTINEELNKIFTVIFSIISDGTSRLKQIHSATNNLAQEIFQTVEGISIHTQVRSSINSITGKLEELITTSSPFVDTSFMNSPEIKKLNQEYTMQEQRNIHSMFFEGESEELQNTSIDQQNNNEFGVNVELF